MNKQETGTRQAMGHAERMRLYAAAPALLEAAQALVKEWEDPNASREKAFATLSALRAAIGAATEGGKG